MNRRYTEQDEALIRRLYPTCRLDSLAFRLGCSEKQLRTKAKRMGLKREVCKKNPWKKRQLRYLVKHYADTPMDVLEENTRHKASSIYYKASSLGLRKSREFIVETGRRNADHPKSVANRFKKGQEPANKGKRLEEFMSKEGIERSSRTRFKKGQAPRSMKPVGYERIDSKDGYVYVKVDSGRGFVLKHRWLWEQAHGEIPKGYVVTFIDGNKTNCTIENLRLISRRENLMRNQCNDSPEKKAARYAKISASIKKIIERDRRRIHFGLEPLGGLVKKW
jgi:hypothetical protein